MLYSSVSSKKVEIMESSDTFSVKMQITYSSAFSPIVMILRNEYQQLTEISGFETRDQTINLMQVSKMANL